MSSDEENKNASASSEDMAFAANASEEDMLRYINFKRQGSGCPICGSVKLDVFNDQRTGKIGLIKIPTMSVDQLYLENGFYPAVGANCKNCGFAMQFYVHQFVTWLRTRPQNG